MADLDVGIECQQHGRPVGDRRAVGDVAAEGCATADLGRREALQHVRDGAARQVALRTEQREQALVRDGTADRDGRIVDLDRLEFGYAGDVDHALEAPVLLGDLEPQVCRAAHEPGGGACRWRARCIRLAEHAQQRGLVRWCEVSRHRHLGCGRGMHASESRRRIGERGEGLGRARQHLAGRLEDAAVAGAAAQVAREQRSKFGKRAAVGGRVGVRARQHGTRQRHHEAGRAVPALRAMVPDHRVLHGMQPARRRERVHRQHLGTMQRGQRQYATVGGTVRHGPCRVLACRPRAQSSDHDSAGPAVAGGTAFLGAGEMQVLAQVVEQGRLRVDVSRRNQVLVDAQLEHVRQPYSCLLAISSQRQARTRPVGALRVRSFAAGPAWRPCPWRAPCVLVGYALRTRGGGTALPSIA